MSLQILQAIRSRISSSCQTFYFIRFYFTLFYLELSVNHENDSTELTPSLIPVNVCETSDTNDVIPADAISSLPGSRAQSPLNGLGRCNRISESSGGSVSLPSTPLSTRTKSPEFFDTKTSRKTSRNGSRTVSPTGDATGRKTPTTKVSLKPNKSATVDLGMLRRTSSSPEIDVPVKEKRGEGTTWSFGLIHTTNCIQAQTANIFSRLFTFETARLPFQTACLPFQMAC